MNQDNGNPVVQLNVFVVSSRKVGPHDPFKGTDEEEVLNAVLSFNGVWPCGVFRYDHYRYEVRRLLRLELFKKDYDRLVSKDAVLGWSEFHIELGMVLGQQHLPSMQPQLAEAKHE
jgi:hypothetical protein